MKNLSKELKKIKAKFDPLKQTNKKWILFQRHHLFNHFK